VELTYLGHSCFKLGSFDGTSVLVDPYTPVGGIRHRPIPDVVSAVAVSHGHPGHCGVRHLQGAPKVFHESGWAGTVELTAIPTFHDTKRGRKLGPNTAWRIVVDGVSVLHLGDMGHMPDNEQLVEMVPADVLLCPVGGVHSLDHEQATTITSIINPMVVVPMHYWTPLVGRRLGRIERFLAGRQRVVPFDGSTVRITPETLPGDQPTWVLRPLY
jgi:L-ascorbate metabolism protein UlaG (beta-lactamase superfamily)